MDPLTQILTLLLTTMSGVLPGSTQNQEKLQQQASQRQLSASDFANDPNQFMARLSNMLGVTGGGAGGAAGGSTGAPGSATGVPSPTATGAVNPESTGPNGAGTNTIAGMMQTLINNFTKGNSQALTNNVWQGLQPQLAASGLGQAPGIANEEMSTALAPYQIQEQQLGSQEGVGALNTGLSTEETNLQYPFDIGSGAAGQFPSFQSL